MILGIDVGGTHTDAVLIDGNRVVEKVKVVTDRIDLSRSLLKVTDKALHETNPEDLERVVLSTTISTNAIVQNLTSPVGMILASGPGLSPSALRINENCHFVSGYVNHRGIPVAPIDKGTVQKTGMLFKTSGIDHIGIVGKFSCRNPDIETDIEDALGFTFSHCSLGHRMSGNLNFPRRIATTYLNASISDIYGDFITMVTAFAGRFKASFPIFILKADGGTFEINQSARYPVQTILSGPAASIMGILSLAEFTTDAVALDIGGTTTDIAIFADGSPLLEPLGVTIAGHKTLIRGLRTRSIGIGGDSAAEFVNGEYIIGPERKGPAAAFGGPCPTPTDAMVVLGLTEIGDKEKALAAIGTIAQKAGHTAGKAAETIFDETCRKIARAVIGMVEEVNNEPVYTIHELLEGKRIKPERLYAVGGPAEPMAPAIGSILGYSVNIPDHAEVANAVGAALARTTTELTVLADTEKMIATIVEEGLQLSISPKFSKADAIGICKEKLRERALSMGAAEEDLELEIIEEHVFNMVRGYSKVGQNIRIKGQVKPGLISRCMKSAPAR
ncbi:MAG: hydantoinase/oxoprolinase family protein [Syntrophales bacterium]|jgi:N-methylhydantoinase A/oxoprolinase/acetone carboxylase beta subunit|nr:hydantoinase/oxoprolinase family protein [Syntrophales bacterium]MDY0044414.1 hydantoinase/oxoprolinase family protein [Syntrophales bacterium]